METFGFSEALSVLSIALDRVEGHAVRSCFIGMTVAGRLGLTEGEKLCPTSVAALGELAGEDAL